MGRRILHAPANRPHRPGEIPRRPNRLFGMYRRRSAGKDTQGRHRRSKGGNRVVPPRVWRRLLSGVAAPRSERPQPEGKPRDLPPAAKGKPRYHAACKGIRHKTRVHQRCPLRRPGQCRSTRPPALSCNRQRPRRP